MFAKPTQKNNNTHVNFEAKKRRTYAVYSSMNNRLDALSSPAQVKNLSFEPVHETSIAVTHDLEVKPALTDTGSCHTKVTSCLKDLLLSSVLKARERSLPKPDSDRLPQTFILTRVDETDKKKQLVCPSEKTNWPVA